MGLYVLAKTHISRPGITFFLFTATIGIWHGTFFVGYCSINAEVAVWWYRLGLASVALIPVANYAFISSVLQTKEIMRWAVRGVYLISGLLSIFTLFTDLVVKEAKAFSWGYFPQFDVLGVVLVLSYVPMLAMVFNALWLGYKGAVAERTKKRIRGLLVGLFIGYSGAVDFVPALGFPLYPFGYLPVLLFVGVWTYVVLRYRLADITPQTAANQILKTMQGALIVVDLEERIRVVNKAACIMFDRAEEEILNNRLSEILQLPAELSDHALLAQQSVKDHELSFPDKQGKEVFLNLSASVLAGAEETPSGIVYVVVDITKHKELEAALAKAKGEAERLVSERTAKLSETVASLRSEIMERKRMEQALTQSAQEWRTTFDSTKDTIILLSRDLEILKANKSTTDLLHLPFRELVGTSIVRLRKKFEFLNDEHFFLMVEETKKRVEREVFLRERGLWLAVTADPILDQQGRFSGAVLIVRDISDIKKAQEEQESLQAQLMQVQKMESIGRLTGGIAHDFNNCLSAVMGYSELALYKLPADHPARDNIKTIYESGEKAVSLTRQLLAFSRKQVLEMKVINLNATIENVKKMLDRLIGEDIELEMKSQKPLKNILADAGQLEQVLMNLVVNARDAMPSGGRITVETALMDVDAESTMCREGLKPGSYVVMSVTDTGEGMSEDIQKNIFEPFFTTKPIGKGTGLGLATVYGIVKQHNGYIYVDSTPGKGSKFQVYLPVVEKEQENIIARENVVLPGGTETILVVDDEPDIRSLVRQALTPLGYRILVARGPEEALRLSDEFEGSIDLLLTDVIMPVMDGKVLADIFLTKRTSKVLFISGYTDDILSHRGILAPDTPYIQKPLSITKLSKKVRQVLDGEVESLTSSPG